MVRGAKALDVGGLGSHVTDIEGQGTPKMAVTSPPPRPEARHEAS